MTDTLPSEGCFMAAKIFRRLRLTEESIWLFGQQAVEGLSKAERASSAAFGCVPEWRT